MLSGWIELVRSGTVMCLVWEYRLKNKKQGFSPVFISQRFFCARVVCFAVTNKRKIALVRGLFCGRYPLFHRLDEFCKGVWMLHCHLGEDFSVKSDIFLFLEGDEMTVFQTVKTECIVETSDP